MHTALIITVYGARVRHGLYKAVKFIQLALYGGKVFLQLLPFLVGGVFAVGFKKVFQNVFKTVLRVCHIVSGGFEIFVELELALFSHPCGHAFQFFGNGGGRLRGLRFPALGRTVKILRRVSAQIVLFFIKRAQFLPHPFVYKSVIVCGGKQPLKFLTQSVPAVIKVLPRTGGKRFA